jgi:hypothetical protein
VVRYVDDIIITSPTLNKIIENAPKVYKFLEERGLQISERKSKIINLKSESFEYLG